MQKFFDDDSEAVLWGDKKIEENGYPNPQQSEFNFNTTSVPLPLENNSFVSNYQVNEPTFRSAVSYTPHPTSQPKTYEPEITQGQSGVADVGETTLRDGNRVNSNVSKYYNRYQNVVTRMFLPKHIKAIIADNELQLVRNEAEFRTKLFAMYKDYQLQMAYHNLNAMVKLHASKYEYQVAMYAESLASQLLNQFRKTLEYHTQELSNYLDRVDGYHPRLQQQATLGANTILEQIRYSHHVILTQFNATLNQRFGDKK